MLKLEIIMDKDRVQKRIDALQQRFPVEVITMSSFYCVVGCYVQMLTEDDKTWLLAMADAKIIHRYRCKEREDR